MHRDGLPGLVLCAFMIFGLGASAVRSDLAGRLFVPGGALGDPRLATVAWVVTGCLVIGICLWWWGPIRVARADLRWRWAGESDRGSLLSRRRAITTGATLIGCVGVGLSASAFVSGAAWRLVLVSVACGVVAMGVTTWRQGTVSAHLTGRARPTLSTRRLHADAVAPDDALPEAVRLAMVTMDFGWLGQVRVVRWQRQRRRGRSRRLPSTGLMALARADLIRVIRRPVDLLAVAAVIASTVAVPMTMHIVWGGPLLLTVFAYRAGSSVASGLTTVTDTLALRRALCLDQWQVVGALAVAPAVAVVVWMAVAIPFWSVGIASWTVVAMGGLAAALRRATRPDLPYDAPVYVLGQGGATQPLLVLTLMRGHVAAVAAGLVACLLG